MTEHEANILVMTNRVEQAEDRLLEYRGDLQRQHERCRIQEEVVADLRKELLALMKAGQNG